MPIQRRVDEMHDTNSVEAYRKLLRTAMELALHPQLPLKSFETLVKCQRDNGVHLIQGEIVSMIFYLNISISISPQKCKHSNFLSFTTIKTFNPMFFH